MMRREIETAIAALEKFSDELATLPTDMNQLAWDFTMVRFVRLGKVFDSDSQGEFYTYYMTQRDKLLAIKQGADSILSVLLSVANIQPLSAKGQEFLRTVLSLWKLLSDFRDDFIPVGLLRVSDILRTEMNLLFKYFTGNHPIEIGMEDAKADDRV
jgi:hypothetical protein